MGKRSRKPKKNEKPQAASGWWAKVQNLSDRVKAIVAVVTAVISILSLTFLVTFFKNLSEIQAIFPGIRYVWPVTIHDSPDEAIDLLIPRAWGPMYGDIGGPSFGDMKYDQTLTLGDSFELGPGINAVESDRRSWWDWERRSGVYLAASKTLPNVTAAEITDTNSVSEADVDPTGGDTPDPSADDQQIDEIDDALIEQLTGEAGTHCQPSPSATHHDRPSGNEHHIRVLDWSGCRYNPSDASEKSFALTGFAVRPSDKEEARANGTDFVAVGMITQLDQGDKKEASRILDSFEIHADQLPDVTVSS